MASRSSQASEPRPGANVLVETYLLNQVTHQTAIASKAARCVLAAHGRPVVDFSLRRTHGTEAGMHAARAGAIAGFGATSNVAAAAALGLPATGTMAHSYVEAFGDEQAAFRAIARNTPGPVTLLIDTYDTERGVQAAADLHRLTNDLRSKLAPSHFDPGDDQRLGEHSVGRRS